MAKYVDGFVLPIKEEDIEAYRKIAQKAGKIWMEYGALQYCEAVGDDLAPEWAKAYFPRAARAKPGETVVFAWITYKSKAHRDQVNKKVMADPRLADMDPKSMPVDMKRMVYGGFKTLVDL